MTTKARANILHGHKTKQATPRSPLRRATIASNQEVMQKSACSVARGYAYKSVSRRSVYDTRNYKTQLDIDVQS